MIWDQWRRTGRLTILLGVAVLALGSNPTRADWGWGFGAFNYVPQPGNFLNDRALIHAANPQRGPISHSPYAGNPNAYFNRVRDNGFVSSYDVGRRIPPSQRVNSPVSVSPGERTANPTPSRAASTPTTPRPMVPLPSFFNSARQLVWPSDSPVAGDLKPKRDIADAGCLVVLGEYQAQGRATIGSVTDSRQKLIDYGQPALQEIRTYATPRIADAFHLFLLSLYESLAQAANPSAGPR